MQVARESLNAAHMQEVLKTWVVSENAWGQLGAYVLYEVLGILIIDDDLGNGGVSWPDATSRKMFRLSPHQARMMPGVPQEVTVALMLVDNEDARRDNRGDSLKWSPDFWMVRAVKFLGSDKWCDNFHDVLLPPMSPPSVN